MKVKSILVGHVSCGAQEHASVTAVSTLFTIILAHEGSRTTHFSNSIFLVYTKLAATSRQKYAPLATGSHDEFRPSRTIS